MHKGIVPCISSHLVKVLAAMGHDAEIVMADAHFPGHAFKDRFLHADGVNIPTLPASILSIFELDQYVTPLAMIAAVPSDKLDPKVEASCLKVIRKYAPTANFHERVKRFTFYERAKKAFAAGINVETAKYDNIILKKGVTPV